MTSFDSYSNEPLDDSIPSNTLPAIFSISELERHCTAYKKSRREDDWKPITQLLWAALGRNEYEQQILALAGEIMEVVSNALQAVLDYLIPRDKGCARQALRLLIKVVAAGAPLPRSLYVENVRLEQGRDVSYFGGFSDVFHARLQTGEPVALKRIRTSPTPKHKEELIRRLRREALVWRQMRHPFILPFLGVDERTFPEHPSLVSPWMTCGTLLDYVLTNKNDGKDYKRLVTEVAEGLWHLHDFGVVHGDIRAINVLMREDAHACLADFGLAGIGDTMTSAAATATTENRSIRWSAPELHDPEAFGLSSFRRTRASDMYAFGGLVLEVFTGRPPFAGTSSETKVLVDVIKGTKPAHWPLPTGPPLPLTICQMLDRCWSAKAFERPEISHVAQAFRSHLRLATMEERYKIQDHAFSIQTNSDELALDVELDHVFDHESSIRGVRFSPDGIYLAVWSHLRVVLIKLRSQRVSCDFRHTLEEYQHIEDICFSPIDRTLATTATDGRIRIWDLKQKSVVSIVETTSRNGFSSLFFTHDGTSILYSPRGGPLVIQGLLSNSGPMSVLQINRPGYSPTDWAALSGTLSNCGRFAACATKHKSIAIWDVKSKILLAHIPYEQFNEPIILFTPDSKGLVIGGLNGIQIQCWNIGSLSKSRSNRNTTKDPLSQPDASRTLNISEPILSNLAVTSDTRWLVFCAKNSVQFCDMRTTSSIVKLDWVFQASIDVSPYSNLFAVSDGCKVLIWRFGHY